MPKYLININFIFLIVFIDCHKAFVDSKTTAPLTDVMSSLIIHLVIIIALVIDKSWPSFLRSFVDNNNCPSLGETLMQKIISSLEMVL